MGWLQSKVILAQIHMRHDVCLPNNIASGRMANVTVRGIPELKIKSSLRKSSSIDR